MTSPPAASFLDFFVLEASEYVEQIDGLLARAAEAGPDAESMQRIARALRGSATMAKLPAFAELASSVESVGRLLRQGTLGWDAGLKGALTGAVDDLKILVRAARAWSPAEDQWAMNRVAELAQYAPSASAAATPVAASNLAYFAAETNNVAAGLELLATRPDDREGAVNVLRRVRALRGVAGVRDIPALAEVSEAAETAVRPIELGEPRLAPERVNVLRAAGELLRAISAGLSRGEAITADTPQYTSFLAALDAMLADVSGGDRVVPIVNLFYDDKGPHVIRAAPNPPTTPAQRFRMEVVSLGEHLHRVIAEARAATEEITREHARGQLGRALRAIRATAASFGQMSVAQTVEAYLERTGDLNVSALDAISTFASSISPAPPSPPPAGTPLRMSQAQSAVASIGTPYGAPAAPVARPSVSAMKSPPPQPVGTPTPAPTTSPPPPATHARVFAAVGTKPAAASSSPGSLDASIAAFESLSGERMAEPVARDDDILPVDALLYRGRAALDRAVELRDAIRRAGGAPPAEVLEELYDLVELARID